MATENTPETNAPLSAGKTKGKLSLKKIILLAGLGLLMAGGGLVAYIVFVDEPPVGKEAQASPVPSKHRVTMPLEPFLVNLADKESRRYLKLKVELEVDNEASAKNLEKSLPRIRDALILLLSGKTYLDLSSLEGKQQLKEEIRKKVSTVPGGGKVTDVFFTEFVAQ
ncbi:MAG: flagellar basal body-associated FliL family protein [Desulfobaccales bacterium]